MFTITRTRDRRYPLILRSEHEDRGPYFLVDLAGFGVAWRKPAVENVPTGEVSSDPHRGDPFVRRVTWIPIFHRARLALALSEHEGVDAKLAKKLADEAFSKLGADAEPAAAERFALHLLSKALPEAS